MMKPEEHPRCDYVFNHGKKTERPCTDYADVWVIWNGVRIGKLCFKHWNLGRDRGDLEHCTYERMPWRILEEDREYDLIGE